MLHFWDNPSFYHKIVGKWCPQDRGGLHVWFTLHSNLLLAGSKIRRMRWHPQIKKRKCRRPSSSLAIASTARMDGLSQLPILGGIDSAGIDANEDDDENRRMMAFGPPQIGGTSSSAFHSLKCRFWLPRIISSIPHPPGHCPFPPQPPKQSLPFFGLFVGQNVAGKEKWV